MSRRGEKDGKLVFAVMRTGGNVLPRPPIQRALTLVTEALLSQGYEVFSSQHTSGDRADGRTRSLIGIRHHIIVQSKFLVG